MIDWLKNINKYPDFWKDYLEKFDTKSNRFVVVSIDTTGLIVLKDVILSISAFAVIDNSIHIGDSFEMLLLQYKYFHDNGISNEFAIETKMKKIGEPQAIQSFVEYIGNAVLVGHQINFDIEMINASLDKLGCGRLKNEAFNVELMYQKLIGVDNKQFSIDDLCTIYKIPRNDRNSVTEEAYILALLFLKLKSRLGLE